jgi:NitT/TauT family transport system substrate-binding protein
MNRTLKLVCALVLGVTLAACGGTDNKPGTSAAPATITLGFSAWPGWFPWQVAEEQGLFTKNGVDVDLKYFESYTDSLTALSTGNLDANSQTLNDTLSSVSGGAKQTVVLVNDNSTGNDQSDPFTAFGNGALSKTPGRAYTGERITFLR